MSPTFQEVNKYQRDLDEKGPGNRDNRPRREYREPTIDKIGQKWYFVANDVFDLAEGGHKLDDDELKALPIRLCYFGENIQFKTDRKEAFWILMKLFTNANRLQPDAEFNSFPVGM